MDEISSFFFFFSSVLGLIVLIRCIMGRYFPFGSAECDLRLDGRFPAFFFSLSRFSPLSSTLDDPVNVA
jgi:hypothetical protein